MRHEDSYEEDWKEEAPLLAGFGKNTELDVPEGYFEDLPAEVLDRIRMLEVPGEEDEWKEEAPILASLVKDDAVDVPEGYFEGLATRVVEQVRSEENRAVNTANEVAHPVRPPRRLISLRRRRFWTVAAGIVLLAVVGTYFLTRPSGYSEVVTPEDETLVQLAALEPSEIAQDLDVSHLTDEQLFQALGSEGEAAFDAVDHAVQQDEAIEYLKDVDLDAIDLQDLDIDLNDLQ